MYEAKYHCDNCGHNFTKRIPKGTEALPETRCPNCECHTAKKVMWSTTVKFRRDKPDRITVDDFIRFSHPLRRPRPIYLRQKPQTWRMSRVG